jgi:hypothetical protein
LAFLFGFLLANPCILTKVASLDRFIQFCVRAKTDDRITKRDYVEAMLDIVPSLQHVETGKNLDEKM